MSDHTNDRPNRSIWRGFHRYIPGFQGHSGETIRVTSQGARSRKAADILARPEAQKKLKAMKDVARSNAIDRKS